MTDKPEDPQHVPMSQKDADKLPPHPQDAAAAAAREEADKYQQYRASTTKAERKAKAAEAGE